MVELRQERGHVAVRRLLDDRLHAFNQAAIGDPGFSRLTLTVRNRGRIVGGLAAEIYFGWMFVIALWIAEKHRGNKHGTALIERAEAVARERGARNVWLDTFAFQAEGFYRKLGYRPFGRLDDYPPGHSRIWLTKAL
jgi:GNAT superfamily N-acetyltransferase